MPTLDLIAISGSGFSSTTSFDVLRISGSGTINTQFTASFIRFNGSGTQRMEIEPFEDVGDKEPFSELTLSARSSGATPTSYTWRVISGPAVPLTSTSANVTFTLPGTVNGAVLTVGVIGHLGAQNSEEQTVSISILSATIKGRVVGSATWKAAGLLRRD
jgi:hypothetical protein